MRIGDLVALLVSEVMTHGCDNSEVIALLTEDRGEGLISCLLDDSDVSTCLSDSYGLSDECITCAAGLGSSGALLCFRGVSDITDDCLMSVRDTLLHTCTHLQSLPDVPACTYQDFSVLTDGINDHLISDCSNTDEDFESCLNNGGMTVSSSCMSCIIPVIRCSYKCVTESDCSCVDATDPIQSCLPQDDFTGFYSSNQQEETNTTSFPTTTSITTTAATTTSRPVCSDSDYALLTHAPEVQSICDLSILSKSEFDSCLTAIGYSPLSIGCLECFDSVFDPNCLINLEFCKINFENFCIDSKNLINPEILNFLIKSTNKTNTANSGTGNTIAWFVALLIVMIMQ
jgi:hypothetical protein